jgi:hypothetical protein
VLASQLLAEAALLLDSIVTISTNASCVDYNSGSTTARRVGANAQYYCHVSEVTAMTPAGWLRLKNPMARATAAARKVALVLSYVHHHCYNRLILS